MSRKLSLAGESDATNHVDMHERRIIYHVAKMYHNLRTRNTWHLL